MKKSFLCLGFLGIVTAVTMPMFAARAPRARAAAQTRVSVTGTLEQMIDTLKKVGPKAGSAWIEKQLPIIAQKIRAEAAAKAMTPSDIEPLIVRVISVLPSGPFAAKLRALVIAPAKPMGPVVPARAVPVTAVRPSAKPAVASGRAQAKSVGKPIRAVGAVKPATPIRAVPAKSAARPGAIPPKKAVQQAKPTPSVVPKRGTPKAGAKQAKPVVTPAKVPAKPAPKPLTVTTPTVKVRVPQPKAFVPVGPSAQEKAAEQRRVQAEREKEVERQKKIEEEKRIEQEQKKAAEREAEKARLAEQALREAEERVREQEVKGKQAALEAERKRLKEEREAAARVEAARTPKQIALQKAIKESESTFSLLVGRSEILHNAMYTTVAKVADNKIDVIAGADKKKQQHILEQAHDVRLMVHDRVMTFIEKYLAFKMAHGTAKEQALYNGMTSSDTFIDYLMTQRPVAFYDPTDTYLLRDGKVRGEKSDYRTMQEKQPLSLYRSYGENPIGLYLSYSEMRIAALIGMSVPTYFINNGARNNEGVKNYEGAPYEPEGVYSGLVGTQFEKKGLMEWPHMIVTKEQNTPEKGYGRTDNPQAVLWAELYNIPYFPTFTQAEADTTGRFLPITITTYDEEYKPVSVKGYLDKDVYKERIKLVVLPFLVDANERGKEENKKVYAHVIGLGTGRWAANVIEQEKLIMQVYAELLQQYEFPYIDTINFSYFSAPARELARYFFTSSKIKFFFSKRNPADALTGKDFGKLLVAMYARNGGAAYPGNEYWVGMRSYSSDSAAICSSTLAELLNPEVNTENVSSKNIRIAYEDKQLAEQELKEPIDKHCACSTCKNYTVAYLHHLFKAKEMTGYLLATVHNLHFMVELMAQYRQRILDGEL